MREINPINNNGSIRLRFTFGGTRYNFNPIPGGEYHNKRDLATAKMIAAKIENDILAGYFDATLERYCLAPQTPLHTTNTTTSTRTTSKPKTLLQLWDEWVGTLDISPATKADHYEMVRRMILKAKPSLCDTAWLTTATISPSTYNKRLGYVKACFVWAVKEGKSDANPFEKVKTRKATKAQVEPFSTEEIAKIILGFQTEAPHYVPFVKFLFLTGARLSEAIGFRWGHIDFARNEFVIRESLSKDRTGNGYTRIRKETKTSSVRHLTMSRELRDLLLNIQPQSVNNDALVFTTVKNCIIDSGNFRGQWKNILARYGVPYRKPHTSRHTTLSMAIEQGTPITGVAYIAGHTDTRMVVQTYGHMINRPKLPDLPI